MSVLVLVVLVILKMVLSPRVRLGWFGSVSADLTHGLMGSSASEIAVVAGGHPEFKKSSVGLSSDRWLNSPAASGQSLLAQSQECRSCCWVAHRAISCQKGLLKVVTRTAPGPKISASAQEMSAPELAGALMWPRLPSSEDAERMELIASGLKSVARLCGGRRRPRARPLDFCLTG